MYGAPLTCRSAVAAALTLPIMLVIRPCAALAQVPTHATVEADARLRPLRAAILPRVERDVPSVAIAVVADGRVVWEEGLGWADRENRIPATPATVYPVASVSKAFMSMAAVALRARHGVTFDAPIARYLDTTLVLPLAGSIDSVTVRDLLAMTGGFPMGGKGRFDSAPPPDPRELLRHHGGLMVFPPGAVFHYSNFSPSVLEPIIERVTGRPFGEFMRREVFDPLGMTSTFFDGYDAPPSGLVEAATYRANGSRNRPYRSAPAGGGGARSSAHDLALFALAHLGEPIGQAGPAYGMRQLPELYAPTAISGGHYALGWWVQTLPGGTTVLKADGHGLGTVAVVQLYPARRLGVVVVTNIRRAEADDAFRREYADIIATEAMEALAPGFRPQYETMLATRDRADGPAELHAAVALHAGMWEGALRTYTGEQIPLTLEVRGGDDIHVTVDQQFTAVVSNMGLGDGGVITGQFPGALPNDEGFDREHVVRVVLLPWRGELIGYFASNWGTARSSFDLPNFVRLRRASAAAPARPAATDTAAVRASQLGCRGVCFGGRTASGNALGS